MQATLVAQLTAPRGDSRERASLNVDINTEVPMDASRDRFSAPVGPLSDSFGEGMAIQRPTCDAGVAPPGSTSLKWGSDGELTAQDLHHVLARLLVHDQEACRMIDGDGSPYLT